MHAQSTERLDSPRGHTFGTLLATTMGAQESQELMTRALASHRNLSEMQELRPRPRATKSMSPGDAPAHRRHTDCPSGTWDLAGGGAASHTPLILLTCQLSCQVLPASVSFNSPIYSMVGSTAPDLQTWRGYVRSQSSKRPGL